MNRTPENEEQQAKRLQDSYLKALSRSFWMLPKAQRAEFQCELRSHLDSLVAEGMYDGASLLEATKAALRQFGRPALIGRGIAREWIKENFVKTPRFAGLVGGAAVILSSLWLLLMYRVLSHVFFPAGKVLVLGKEGAKMSIENGVLQVASGEAGMIAFNPLTLTLAIAIPFLIVFVVALVGCVSFVRRQPILS